MKAKTESKAPQPAAPAAPGPFRDFDHALHEVERRMDRLLPVA